MTPSLPFGFERDEDHRENMAAPDDATALDTARSVEAWKRNATLQHHSRAFDRFLPFADNDASRDDRFFVPSYLEKSTYVQKLKEAHNLKVMARQDLKPVSGGDFQSSLADFPSSTLPPGSHRGLSHTVIERPLPSVEEDALPPLPTAWNKDDSFGGIEISPDGRTTKYNGPRNHHERDQEACAVRANHYMPPQCGIYYYEVEIISSKKDEYVGT
jgi:Ran-binding protein 9/10